MDMQLTRIEAKIDQLVEKVGVTNIQLALHSQLHKQNSIDLAHHIKRTDLLQDQMEMALLPIKTGKVVVVLASSAATIYGLYQLITSSL